MRRDLTFGCGAIDMLIRNSFVVALVDETVKNLRMAVYNGRYVPNFQFTEHCGWDYQDYDKTYNLFKLNLGLGQDVFLAGNEEFTRFCLVNKGEDGRWETNNIFNAGHLPLDWCERILDAMIRMDLDKEP
jgi:hypothetical protein